MNTRRDILEELRTSRRTIASGLEVTPRFVVYSPSGNHIVVISLPDDEDGRRAHLRLARLFMVWKAATGFILICETKSPDALTATLVTRDEVMSASQLISRDPVKFAEPVWYGREGVDEEIIDLLPAKSVQLSADEMLIIQGFEDGLEPDLTSFKPKDDDE
jgi:hypothetical protein